MISCPKCGTDNPLTTTFCRGCGERLSIGMAQVASSLASTSESNRNQEIFAWGRSAVTLSAFLLISALILRYLMVPAVPQADLPSAPYLPLFASDDGAAAASPVAAPASAPAASSAPGALAADRLSWRRREGPAVLTAFGIDVGQLATWQKGLIAVQKPDGSMPGEDAFAATGLASLAFQAYPIDPLVTAAGERARAWLIAQGRNLSRRQGLGRALGALALADADALDESTRLSLGVLMVDGTAPVWQAMILPALPGASRPKEIVGVSSKLAGPLWECYFALLAGTRPQPDAKLYFNEAAQALVQGEERWLWAFTAWHHPIAPKDLAEALRGWSKAAPAAVDPALAKACGPLAASAVAVLTVTAPLRVAPLQLAATR